MDGLHLSSMSRAVRIAIAVAICVVGMTAAATLAVAAPSTGRSSGTIEIDARSGDNGHGNDPHVTCTFKVKFYNFDTNERVNIIFTAQPPTGHGQVLLRLDNVLVSRDPAGGKRRDPDETLSFSINMLNLTGLTAHRNQGYHVKLTIQRLGKHGGAKHKVFWIRPCPPPSPSPSCPSPTVSSTLTSPRSAWDWSTWWMSRSARTSGWNTTGWGSAMDTAGSRRPCAWRRRAYRAAGRSA